MYLTIVDESSDGLICFVDFICKEADGGEAGQVQVEDLEAPGLHARGDDPLVHFLHQLNIPNACGQNT